ncbi:hypothetical protein AYI68_g1420 [Smittium mucronatum]|uniref:Uncharacterized protein n=1 Tax=Smittium mucronatum TaxID=133383 RepID=A0A1R0H5J3_9FUNG|nr:hypothetical protein AYI68_g1420 [Smittium mucronatum]
MSSYEGARSYLNCLHVPNPQSQSILIPAQTRTDAQIKVKSKLLSKSINTKTQKFRFGHFLETSKNTSSINDTFTKSGRVPSRNHLVKEDITVLSNIDLNEYLVVSGDNNIYLNKEFSEIYDGLVSKSDFVQTDASVSNSSSSLVENLQSSDCNSSLGSSLENTKINTLSSFKNDDFNIKEIRRVRFTKPKTLILYDSLETSTLINSEMFELESNKSDFFGKINIGGWGKKYSIESPSIKKTKSILSLYRDSCSEFEENLVSSIVNTLKVSPLLFLYYHFLFFQI